MGSNKLSSRLESAFANEVGAWQRAILEPGRNVAVVCFERVTSLSTRKPEPGRNAPWQTEPFAKNALGKPGRNADAKLETEGFFVAGKPEIGAWFVAGRREREPGPLGSSEPR